MSISRLLEMAISAGDRVAVTYGDRSLTASQVRTLARAAARRFEGRPAVLYIAPNHPAYPVALFGAALAGVPFVPLNYRLGEKQMTELRGRHPGAVELRPGDLDALVDPALLEPGGPGDGEGPAVEVGDDDVAVILYTSGTTAAPKAAVLRHRHLLAYVLNTLVYASAEEDEAALVAVPPYHVAGLANFLTNLYTGRRVVYLPSFDAREWLETVRRERITHTLLVPTMLARIVAEVKGDDAGTPTLRSLAYGGARTPRPVLERALKIFPGTGFVNAYGLTETASSVAVLGPGDHRKCLASDDPEVRARLASVGRPLRGVEFQIRDENGTPLPPGETGLVFVRGEQISGEYGGRSALDADGWFATRDRGYLDEGGYLFIEGRADDTIIRGGENIAPAEIEDVILAIPGIEEAAVVGVSDPEWGQRLVAVVAGEGDPEDVRRRVRERLRSSKTPDTVVFRDELPKTETGKILRRVLQAELENTHA